MAIIETTAIKAWYFLSQHTDSALVDVRTDAEWHYVGIPELSGINKHPILVSLLLFPHNDLNHSFKQQVLEEIGNLQKPIKHLFFICRTGGRSQKAAEIFDEMNLYQVYNVVDGFEGDLDGHSQRNKINGWKFAKLPWRQS